LFAESRADVRFARESGQLADISGRPSCARKRHLAAEAGTAARSVNPWVSAKTVPPSGTIAASALHLIATISRGV
jgi:hypothetical protein